MGQLKGEIASREELKGEIMIASRDEQIIFLKNLLTEQNSNLKEEKSDSRLEFEGLRNGQSEDSELKSSRDNFKGTDESSRSSAGPPPDADLKSTADSEGNSDSNSHHEL